MNHRSALVALAIALLLSGSAHAQVSTNTVITATARVGTELVLGTFGTVLGSVASFYLGASVSCIGSHDSVCGLYGFAWIPFGIAAAVPFSVWGAGTSLGGQGGLLPTMLGSTLATASAVLLFYVTHGGPLQELWSSVLLFLVPMVGGIIGYEISNALAQPRPGLPAAPPPPVQIGFAVRI